MVAVEMPLLTPLLLGALALAASGPTNSSRPVVTGTLQVGHRLVASPGSWFADGTIAYAYQWYRCDRAGARCSTIRGATAGTYTQVSRDARRTIGVTVRATDASGTTVAYAALVGMVATPTATMAATRPPALSGEPVVGHELAVGAPRLTGPAGALSYAWRRCSENGRLCAPIAGATQMTYTPVAADVGHVVTAAVTTSGLTVLSSGLGTVRATPGPVALELPSIAGTLRRGAKLRGAAGTWSGTGTITYAYQWRRCDGLGAHCDPILGATKGTYTEVARDVGRTLGLTVRATDSAGTTTAYSSLAGIVAAPDALAATAQPTLAGVAAVGRTLTAPAATWTSPPTSLGYTWLRCNANGRRCSAIPGAGDGSYTPTADDVGHTLVAKIAATAGTASGAVLTVASSVVS
jgi:hypothetical protein